MIRRRPIPAHALLLVALTWLFVGCDDGLTEADLSFLDGTLDDARIGLIVNSTGRAVRMFQVGRPDETREVGLGASPNITPVDLSVRDDRVVVPLGNAASVALLDPARETVERTFLFGSGNATGSAFVDDETVLAANSETDIVGRLTLGQPSDQIQETVGVDPNPSIIRVAGDRALVLSSNLDENFQPLGPGVVTALDPSSLTVLGTVETGGTNPNGAAVGPDGLLYVANTGDFVNPGSLAVIDPATLQLLDVHGGFGVGPGAVAADEDGLIYVSGFFFGTIVWDSATETFVRGPDDPVCAPLDGDGCRGAFAASPGGEGELFQVFFGSASEDLPAWIFVYDGPTFQLVDSVAAGQGPTAIEIATFR